MLRLADGTQGSLTLLGTVSPAGGNFEEPVTQSTLATVKTFLGLSYDRAYKRFYPAIDPLISWSRYLEQLKPWYATHLGPTWTERVQALMALLKAGDAALQMMQVTGEEGVTLEDFVTYQKALFLDLVYLQQDAYDPVDASAPLERQQIAFNLVYDLVQRSYGFTDKDEARAYFTRLTGLFKNFNYARDSRIHGAAVGGRSGAAAGGAGYAVRSGGRREGMGGYAVRAIRGRPPKKGDWGGTSCGDPHAPRACLVFCPANAPPMPLFQRTFGASVRSIPVPV